MDDEFLIALTEKPSQIECLFIAECNFTAEGLKYLRKVIVLSIILMISIEAAAVECDRAYHLGLPVCLLGSTVTATYEKSTFSVFA